MKTTLVLFLLFNNSQIATVQNFYSMEDCQRAGHWYQDQSTKTGEAPVKFRCGPGPTILAPAEALSDMIRGMGR